MTKTSSVMNEMVAHMVDVYLSEKSFEDRYQHTAFSFGCDELNVISVSADIISVVHVSFGKVVRLYQSVDRKYMFMAFFEMKADSFSSSDSEYNYWSEKYVKGIHANADMKKTAEDIWETLPMYISSVATFDKDELGNVGMLYLDAASMTIKDIYLSQRVIDAALKNNSCNKMQIINELVKNGEVISVCIPDNPEYPDYFDYFIESGSFTNKNDIRKLLAKED